MEPASFRMYRFNPQITPIYLLTFCFLFLLSLPSTAQITADISASRVSGVAPLSVIFDDGANTH